MKDKKIYNYIYFIYHFNYDYIHSIRESIIRPTDISDNRMIEISLMHILNIYHNTNFE